MNKKLKEWEQASSSFDFDETFVLKQIKKNKHKKVYLNILKTCFAVLACIFILTNTSHDYVKATKDIPILNKINELFSLNKNMLVAIENDYIQELNITKKQGDIQVNVDYMIVDEKSIYLFYQVTNNGNRLRYTPDEYQASIDLHKENYSAGWSGDETDEYDIIQYELNYTEEEFSIDLFDFIIIYQGDKIRIPINIDQNRIAKAKRYEVNQTFKIKGQEFIVTNVEIYPLKMEIHTTQAEDNDYLVKNAKFELKLNGKVRDKEEGTQSYGMTNSLLITYVMPSTYFLGDNISLTLKSVELIKKPGIVTYDLQTNTFDDPTGLIKDMRLYTKNSPTPHPYQHLLQSHSYCIEVEVNDSFNLESEGRSPFSFSWDGTYSDFKDDNGNTIYQIIMKGNENEDKLYFYPCVGNKVEVNKKVKLK